MAPIALIFGALLIALGLTGYSQPDLFGATGPEGKSPTALIPAGFGGIMALCGVIALLAPGARKHAMHLAAAVGVLGILGGFVPLIMRGFNFKLASVVSSMLMVGLSFIFVLLCVNSFIAARKARQQAPKTDRTSSPV